jgi:predicted ATPase
MGAPAGQAVAARAGAPARPPDDFARQVHDALAHLYDPVTLQTHPLHRWLTRGPGAAPPARGAHAGRVLQQRLLDAIALLQPRVKRTERTGAHRDRGYQLLQLRYVDGLDPVAVQQQLGISSAQYYRDHARAVHAVVTLLADQWTEPGAAGGVSGAARSLAPPLPPPLPPSGSGQGPAQGQGRGHGQGAPTNLRLPATPFVGREAAIAQIRHLLGIPPTDTGLTGTSRAPGPDSLDGRDAAAAPNACRLLTLTGTAGTGKTRLALRVAAEAAVAPAAYPDGVWLVELAALADPALVLHAVASVLSVAEQPGAPPEATLIEALRTKRLLLVLDNCEHLLAAAPALAGLLAACPHLQVLATSREALRVAGEQELHVPPLALPEAPGPPRLELLAGSEAVRLFVVRARARRPAFTLSSTNARAVADLCRRLDGLPLAIELAAARVPSLPPLAMLARLEHRLPLLTSGARDAPARHRTLGDAIGWSYELLTAPEQALFARLSVFAGGWSLAAAEAVASDGVAPARAGDGAPPPAVLPAPAVLDTLCRLVDKSLVVADEDGDGRVRYRCLETLREYAGQRLLESGQAETYRERHLRYVVALVEAAERELQGPAQREWLERLEREHDNCRAALRRLLDRPTVPAVEQGLRLVGALCLFWTARGPRVEARSWLAAFLTLPGPHRPTAARARALNLAAIVADWFGDAAAKRRWLEECAALARAAEDPRAAAWALQSLGDMASRRGNTAEAAAWLTQSLALFRQVHDHQATARTLSVLGLASSEAGDYDGARRYLEESLAIYRRLGNRHRAATQLLRLGTTWRAAGAAGAARPYFEEALAIWRELGYENGIAGALNALGEVAVAVGDTAQAARLFAGALERYRSETFRDSEAAVLRNLARLAWATGDAAAARARLAEALGIWRAAEAAHRIADTLEAFAVLAAAHDQPERALRLAGAAAARRAAGCPLSERQRTALDQQLEPARLALGQGAAAALGRGRALSLDEAVDEAVAGAPAADTASGRDAAPTRTDSSG